jgi:prophage antirepressor-like protein
MSGVQRWEAPTGEQLRTVEIDGEPWFVAMDVCRALEIESRGTALSRIDAEDKGVCSIDTPGGLQQVSIVNEPGLYELTLGSRKPEAKAFKRWITHDVLPEIRMTGSYSAHPSNQVQQAAPAPSLLDALRGLVSLAEDAEEQRTRLVAVETTQAETVARLEQLTVKVDRRDPDDESLTPITVTTIGQRLTPPISGAAVNRLLQELGFQWHQDGRWTATYEGRPYAVVIPVKHASGRLHDSLKWQARIVPVIERRMTKRRAFQGVSAVEILEGASS